MTELTNRDPEPEYPLPRWRGLRLSWVIVLGAIVACGALLQTLGPPRDSPAEPPRDRVPLAQSGGPGTTGQAASVSTSANPSSGVAKVLSGEEIGALLAKVQAQISETPEGAPPGSSAADMLKRVAAALPKASPQDRELATDMAADLYDRAKAALQAGKVAEEQHWLALGSILAPPPDLSPNGPENTTRTAQALAGPSTAQSRQDITPNEAEVEQPGAKRTHSTAPASRRDMASADTEADRVPQQIGTAPAPVPAPAQATAAEPTTGGTAEAANSSDTSSSAGGTQQASGKSVAIHVLASSAPAQEQKLKQLTARLRSNFDQTVMRTEADVPRTAVVVYGSPADHSKAKNVGRVLGAMGYSWHLERIATEPGDATSPTVDVWLPSEERVP